MAHLIINQVACITPSYGVSDWFVGGMSVVTTAFGAGLGTIIGAAAGAELGAAAGAAAGAVTGPAAVVVAPIAAIATAAGGGTVGGVIGGTVGTAIGAGVSAAAAAASKELGQLIADQVYLKANDENVWPTGDGILTPTVDMKSDDTEDPNITIPIPNGGYVTLELMEWDNLGDDTLGSGVFTAQSESSVYSFQNSEEGSIYYLTITVIP